MSALATIPDPNSSFSNSMSLNLMPLRRAHAGRASMGSRGRFSMSIQFDYGQGLGPWHDKLANDRIGGKLRGFDLSECVRTVDVWMMREYGAPDNCVLGIICKYYSCDVGNAYHVPSTTLGRQP